MYVCVYVCMYVRTYVRTYTHMSRGDSRDFAEWFPKKLWTIVYDLHTDNQVI